MPKTEFPHVIDSTILAAARSCGRKVQLEYLEHWKPFAESVHLVAGAAYAKGLEVARRAFYVEGASPEVAVARGGEALLTSYGSFECPPDSAKSAQRTLGALVFYFDSYPLGQDRAIPIQLPGGGVGIEFSFAEPLDYLHPETGDPILYAGRMDMLVTYDGMTLGEDDKTASQLGASWPRQWDLRSQFTGYCWGAAKASIKLDGFLVRGVSILKTKYDTLQAITYRPQWMIDRWYEQVHRDLANLQRQWETDQWNFSLDHACEEYGGCLFKQACLMRDPQPLLEQHFSRRRWDPVAREEVQL
jgi:hypothetical protein